MIPGNVNTHSGNVNTDSGKIPKSVHVEPEWLFSLLRNRCSRWTRMGVHNGPEYAQAEIIIKACAKTGIIALVDEATGYQAHRKKNALQLKLRAFISEEMQEWVKVFPDEFWLELARLENINYNPRSRPLRWGKYVMMFVYDAIDEDVANELRKKNPDPHYKMNHHQWLREHGKDLVKSQIWQNIGIMRTCQTMDDFRSQFKRIFQKEEANQLALDFDELES